MGAYIASVTDRYVHRRSLTCRCVGWGLPHQSLKGSRADVCSRCAIRRLVPSGPSGYQPIPRNGQHLQPVQTADFSVPRTISQQHSILHKRNRRIAVPPIRIALNNPRFAPRRAFVLAHRYAQWRPTARRKRMTPRMIVPHTNQIARPGNAPDRRRTPRRRQIRRPRLRPRPAPLGIPANCSAASPINSTELSPHRNRYLRRSSALPGIPRKL